MNLGINLMAWTDHPGPEHAALFAWLRELGFDGIELPVLDPVMIDVEALHRGLQSADLRSTVSTALPAGASLIDPEQHRHGIAFLVGCIRVAHAIGAEVVCGPLYAPVGLDRHSRTQAEWRLAVSALRQVAVETEYLGVRLAIEPINRFESAFLNLTGDGARLVREVDHPLVGLLVDTFHMNIEEKAVPAAVRAAGAALTHVHFSENDRGVVGSGHVPWSEIVQALRAISYDGWIVCETFSGTIAQLAAATAIWRPLVPSPEAYARESLRGLCDMLGAP